MFLDRELGTLTEPMSGRSWDRSELQRKIERRTGCFVRRGFEPGDRVFLNYGNTLEFFVDLMTVWTLGGCAVPVDSRLTSFEVEALAAAAAPRYSVWSDPPGEDTARVLARHGVECVPSTEDADPAGQLLTDAQSLDQDALILFTSGTTGQPKGVVHTHRSLRARWMSLRHCLGTEAYRRSLCLLPTHFGHGLICNCLFPWLSGQHLFIVPPFRPDIVMGLGRILDEHRITFMSSVPSVWRLALRTARPPEAGTLERVSCGSAPLSAAVWSDVQRWAETKDVLNAYGITETGSWLAGTTVPDFEPEDGLIGEAWGGVIRVLRSGSTQTPPGCAEECDPGEPGYVWVNTPALMRGYFGRDDLTREVVSQGWFVTGDIGIVDERGYLVLKGREREEINKGGLKVYPGDVDAVVERFEGATDVCTFGYEDPLHGENVGIALVLDEPSDSTLGELYEWVSRHLARHKMPERWYLVDEIPRTSRGKINRANVGERCAALDPLEMRRIMRGRGGRDS